MDQAPDEIKSKLAINNHSTKSFDKENFIQGTELVLNQSYKIEFKDDYEIWYHVDTDKATFYKGITFISSVHNASKTDIVKYIMNLSQLSQPNTTCTDPNSEFCSCRSPKIQKTLLFNVDYFDLCTDCKKEYKKPSYKDQVASYTMD